MYLSRHAFQPMAAKHSMPHLPRSKVSGSLVCNVMKQSSWGDIAKYNDMDADDSGEDRVGFLSGVYQSDGYLLLHAKLVVSICQETGWKLVHGDVFRKPPHSKACLRHDPSLYHEDPIEFNHLLSRKVVEYGWGVELQPNKIVLPTCFGCKGASSISWFWRRSLREFVW